MSLVEIACFVEDEHAELAARFLRRHGVKAKVPVMYFRWKVNHPHRVFVDRGQAEKAKELLRRVAAGEFSDEDPLDNTRGGLGAALAAAVLPKPGYRPPSWIEGHGPIVLILLAGVAWAAGLVLRQLLLE